VTHAGMLRFGCRRRFSRSGSERPSLENGPSSGHRGAVRDASIRCAGWRRPRSGRAGATDYCGARLHVRLRMSSVVAYLRPSSSVGGSFQRARDSTYGACNAAIRSNRSRARSFRRQQIIATNARLTRAHDRRRFRRQQIIATYADERAPRATPTIAPTHARSHVSSRP
jgi:hypothetical protein